MEISTLCYLSRLYNLVLSLKEKEERSFYSIYEKILHQTSKDILYSVPEEISIYAEKLFKNFSKEGADEFLSLLEEYKKECDAYLPDLSEAKAQFHSLLADEFCENGYFYKNGAFRKIRGKHFFLIEADLEADFLTDTYGRVTELCVTPVVRIADAKVFTDKEKKTFVAGMDDDEVSYTDIKRDEKAFRKTLRHLEKLGFKPEDDIKITSEDIEKLYKSAAVAAPVCENRAIPSYYKKLCKNDFPRGKAFSIALWEGILAYILITLLVGGGAGIGAYFAMGLTKTFGLFELPIYYLVTALPALFYGFIVYKKTRSGRY